VLTGSLASICNRSPSFSGPVGSSSSGGSAATSIYLPKILQQHLKRFQNGDTGGGAGDDINNVTGLGSGWTGFFSGEYQSLDRSISAFEDGYRSDVGVVTAGVDKQFAHNLLAGAAFSYSRQSGNFIGAGDFGNDSYGILTYALFKPIENAYIQLNAGYAFRNYQRNRLASYTDVDITTGLPTIFSGFAESDYDGHDFQASILTGYDFNFGGLTISPRAGFNWTKNNYDSYDEQGGSGLELRFDDDHRTSLQTSFGVLANYAFSTSFGVLVPQFSADWIHEFHNNQRNIRVSFLGDTRNQQFAFQNERPDRDFMEFTAGTSMVLPNGIQTFVNYRGWAGHNYFDSHGVSAGVRMEF
jgi:outer membrane autotransporter protein